MLQSPYLRAIRPRTLPLSLAGVGFAIIIAQPSNWQSVLLSLFIILTTILLQIIANLANELGDFQHGTDQASRHGPQYVLTNGLMTPPQLQSLLFGCIIAVVLCGSLLIWLSYHHLLRSAPLLLLLVGLTAIISSLKYTLGHYSYGHFAMGDLFVFLYFGLVAVMGAYFVITHTLPYHLLLPAISIGLWSVSVLNLNNMRDMKTDCLTRTTIAILLGLTGARIYQTILISVAWLCMLVYYQWHHAPWYTYLFILCAPASIYAIQAVWQRQDRGLDPLLPLLTLTTCAFSLLSAIGLSLA